MIKTGSIGKIKDLGLSEHDYAILMEAIEKPTELSILQVLQVPVKHRLYKLFWHN
jgi:hypothetical protein